MRKDIKIRPATQQDLSAVSSLAMRSKAHWGYSPEFMAACKDELTYTETELNKESTHFYCAERDGKLEGFYLVSLLAAETPELHAMFIEPASIGSGTGKVLMTHALTLVRRNGHHKLRTQADPYAEPFYTHMGAATIGQRESESIPGRYLPLMEFTLD